MKKILSLLAVAAIATELSAQTPLSREQILAMNTDELSELPLEDLMQAVETLGVSSVDELFAMIMNKNVSSASKEEESTFTSQLATTVITKDELRSWGATTIEDAFRLIPGMIVSQTNNGVYDIHMRGLNNIPENEPLIYTNNNNMQLMVDGRSVQNLITGAILMDQMPISIEDVERIEVVRGACSALYGMNAVTGIVNIITEKPSAGSEQASGSVQVGNMDTYIADFALRHTFNDMWSAGFTVNGQRRSRNTDKIYITPTDGVYYDINNAYPAQTAVSDASILKDETKFKDASYGGFYSISDIKRLRQYLNGNLYNVVEDDSPLEDLFPNPGLARENFGINGYLRFTPKKDVTFDLTGGYQSSYALNMSPKKDYFAQVGTTSQTGYVNFEANIHDLRILANYSGGPQDFSKGVDGFKVKSNVVNAQAEYNFKIGEEVSLRPGVAYNYLYYKDYARQSKSHPEETISLLGGHSDISVISPSVRAQWSHNGFSLTAAVRADKTSKPDKWNTSYLAAASYKFNEDNFIRLAYGHAFRGPNMINTSVNYTWYRTNLKSPSMIFFLGNDEADLMNLDNVEIGYRWKPSPRVLLDAEFFLSKSQDYGAITSSLSSYTISKREFTAAQAALSGAAGTGITDPAQLISYIMSKMQNYSQFEYQNMPYKVYQMGLSLNLDYIISSKLILKLNANIQRTKVDDYYAYNLESNVMNQITKAGGMTVEALTDLVQGEYYHKGYANAAFNFADYYKFRDATNWNSWTTEQREAVWNQLHQYAISCIDNGQAVGATTITIDNPNCPESAREQYVGQPLSMYFAMKYAILSRWSASGEEYEDCGTNVTETPELSNGHKHKATPAIYGMVGLIYKPISQVNVSAYCNYTGKRTYDTASSAAMLFYGRYNDAETELKPKFTLNLKVGYKPTDNIEVFLNANNLFDNDKKEMVYCDKIGGLYTIGVNFGF